MEEKDYLLKKNIKCPVCEAKIQVLALKSGKVVRTESDMDLRPRNTNGFDSLKYGAYSCPVCGYTALSRTFDEILRPQRKLVKEQIQANFVPKAEEPLETYSYDDAIKMHKMALLTAMVKRAKMSEKAYTALVIAWLWRGKRELLTAEDEERVAKEEAPVNGAEVMECINTEREHLKMAYDGFVTAMAEEVPPFIGMDMTTTEYLMAALAYEIGNYEDAAKLISRVITDKYVNSRVKNKALDIKDKILGAIREKEEA
ncbi:MAG: DUF2225 domain-containing protein [Eubacterium sp.]|nr:DUF2225 domain-containing protein [Eubacterium sp.]